MSHPTPSTPDAPTPSPYSRVQLLIILLTPVIVVVSSSLLYFSGALMSEDRSNNGILLTPVLSVTDFGLPEIEISQDRHWQLIQFSPQCEQQCLEKVMEQRQMHIALGKRQARIKRVLLTETDVTDSLGTDFPRLELQSFNAVNISENLTNRVPPDVLAQNPIFVVDPFGNIMLYFTNEHDYKAQMSDIKKLLKLSTIG